MDGIVDGLLFKPVKSSYDLEFRESRRKLIAIRGAVPSRPGAFVYVPCIVSPASAPCRTLVIHFHGTGGDIAKSGPWFEVQRHVPVHVISVEYPGYGAFPGFCVDTGCATPPSEASVLDAAHIVVAHVRDAWKWDLGNVIVAGRSMGSGPACVLAAEAQPGAVAILSGFASLQDVAVRKLKLGAVARLLCRERFFNERRLQEFKGHGFVFHGGADTLIVPEHGRRLHNALGHSAATRELAIDPTGTHSEVKIVAPLAAFVRRFESEGTCGSPRELPMERFDPTGADALTSEARAWFARATAGLAANRRRRALYRQLVLAIGAVVAVVTAYRWLGR